MSEVEIRAGDSTLRGELQSPPSPRGLVVFVHGSGSSRHSPRNQAVADSMRRRGLATLLFDLLTQDEGAREDAGAMARFDIGFLARRLDAVLDHVEASDLRGLPIGLFGSSTGAAAALVSAARRPVAGVVSRGGRPDLAEAALRDVQCPVLLIIGQEDDVVLGLNRDASRQLHAPVDIHVVKGATHLFEEPGTLDEAADVAGRWFLEKLTATAEAR